MRRKFFFQENDIKISDFDEGVFILEPFFCSNVLFKICFFCSKSHDWGNEEFLLVPSPDCNTAELRNECFSLCVLSSFYKARTDTLSGGAKQWTFAVRQLWLLRQKWQILKITLPQKNGHRIKIISWCHLVGKRILYAIMDTACLFCASFSLKSLIVIVAFLLGHPV